MPDSLQSELQQAKKRFTVTSDGSTDTFREARKNWDKILFRELPQDLPPEVTGAQEGLDFQTPDLEKAVTDWKAILKMNPTVYDTLPLETSQTAKELAREILLYTARGWEHENEGRWWDDSVGEGQVRHGLKIMQQRWREVKEPDVDVSDIQRDDDESDDAFEARQSGEKMKRREAAMKKRRHPFYWTEPDLYGCYWIGDERTEFGPDVFFYEYEIPMIEAQSRFRRRQDDEEQKITFNEAGKLGWMGQDEAVDSSMSDARVKVIIRDGRDLSGRKCPLPECDHAQRVIEYFVGLRDADITEANRVESYDSPFPGCSFHIVGGFVFNNRDPHYRYRPAILPMYVEASWINYLNTLLATIARTDYSDEYFYVDLTRVPEHVRLPEGGQTMVLDKPEPGSNQIPAYPGPVSRFPKSMSPHLMTLLQESEKRMAEYKPNRFLIGTAFTEASNATGAAFLNQSQQAALPANSLLSESDKVQLRSRRYEYHAVKFWAMTDPEDVETKYFAVMTGGMKTTPKDSMPGEVVWISGKRLDMNFDLVVLTESETLAEEQQKWFVAKDKHAYGVIDDEQLLRAAGSKDVEGQKVRLRIQETRRDVEPTIRELRRTLLLQRASVRIGLDLSALMGGDPALQSAGAPEGANTGNPAVQQGNALQAVQPSGVPVSGGGSPL